MDDQIEQWRDQATKLCTELGISIRPYGHVWWLVGHGVNRVVAELAGLCRSDLRPLAVMERQTAHSAP